MQGAKGTLPAGTAAVAADIAQHNCSQARRAFPGEAYIRSQNKRSLWPRGTS